MRTFRSSFESMTCLGCVLLLLGCSSSSGTQEALPPSTGMVSLCFSGTSSEDWASLDFKVVGITLAPQDGGAAVTLVSSQGSGLPFNMVQLDHLGQFMGNYAVPLGKYAGATVTLSTAARTDLALYEASVPSSAFPGTGAGGPGSKAPMVFVQGGGSDGTLALTVPFATPLAVTTDSNVVLDLDWDSASPSFLVGAPQGTAGAVFWTVAFDHVLRQRPVADPAHMSLLPTLGAVYSVAADHASFQLSGGLGTLGSGGATLPQFIQVRPDAIHGTTFIDLNAGTTQVIHDLSTVGDALPGRGVRVEAVLQRDGSLLASRIWAGGGMYVETGTETSAHIASVDTGTGWVQFDASQPGGGAFLWGSAMVDPSTSFNVLSPLEPALMASPVGTGTAFLASPGLFRGFLVHQTIQWPQASGTPPYLGFVDIESAPFKGALAAVGAGDITCACPSGTSAGDVLVTLPFIAPATPSATAADGTEVSGFSWTTFNDPSTVNGGPGAIDAFAAAAGASVDFGGTVGLLRPWAVTLATWGDAANPSGWSAGSAVLQPTPLPQATVAAAWSPSASGGSLGITVAGGANTVTVDVAGPGPVPTRVYQVRGPGPQSILGGYDQLTPLDLATSAGQAALASLLVQGAAVQVFGIPGSDGHLQAGILFCYTYTE